MNIKKFVSCCNRGLLLSLGIVYGVFFVAAKPAFKGVMRVAQPDGTELSIIKRGDEWGHKVYTEDGFRIVRNAKGIYEYAVPAEDGRLVASGVAAKDARLRTAEDAKVLAPSLRSGSATAMIGEGLGTPSLGSGSETAKRGATERGGYTPEGSVARRGVQTRGPGLYHYTFPTKGEQKGLVILVEFDDVKFNSKNKAPFNTIPANTYFNELLNKDGFDTYGGTGSARDWFVYNSKGQFKPEFDVFGPVALPNTMKYYGENDRWTDDDKRPGEMVVDACKALDDVIDFRDYDRNGDGYVDNVYVIYAGLGEADSDESNAIWPHSWTLSEAVGSPLFLDGVYVDSYGCSNETRGYDDYGNLSLRPDGIGTFVHEFSHVMGLPDLYATEYSVAYTNEPFTPGEFSVMDYGPYNNEGRTPPNYSAYERYALDWLQPEELTGGNKLLEEIGESNRAFIAKTENDREFYLFENRQLSGWDKYLPYHGMLVWHVDYYAPVFYNNTVNNNKMHQYVDLIEADNIQDYPIGYNRYPASTQTGDPFPGAKEVAEFGPKTAPALVSWGGKSLGIALSGIKENAGVVSFDVHSENAAGVEAVETTDGEWEAFSLDGKCFGIYKQGMLPAGIYILRSKNGKFQKIAI